MHDYFIGKTVHIFLKKSSCIYLCFKGSYIFNQEEDLPCSKSQMAKFSKQKYQSWFDPDNWATLDQDDLFNGNLKIIFSF